jgi:REP element-mobilizing transposase RayT
MVRDYSGQDSTTRTTIPFFKARHNQRTQRYWGQHMWARGYFCATVGAVDEATIKADIENQKWDEDDEGFKITAPTEP